MTKNKQMVVNMLASIITYAVSLGINFFLTPYIVENVGVDAYGFVGLANNFVSYAGLITIALNSMASRFVTIKIYENDLEGANRYYSSVFFANLFLSFLLGAVFLVLLVFLEQIIHVPQAINTDVKALFAALFLNCILSVVGTVFHIATFATNKLYLSSLRDIEANILRAVLTVALFCLLTPHISYIGMASLLSGFYVVCANLYYTKKLLPSMRIQRSVFDLKAIWEVVRSGVWNLVTRLGTLLLDGVDLLVTNLFINPVAMGVLSIAKIIPGVIQGIVGTLAGIFSPNFTILYAEKKMEELVAAVKQSMKIMGIITNIPIIILLVCGRLFFSLWQPTQDAVLLHNLSVLTCACFILNGGVNCIYNIFTVVNKLRFNAALVCISGILNVGVVFLLLKTTSLGIYAVAGVSTVITILRNLFFVIPYGAVCLNMKWYGLYAPAMRCVAFVALACVLGALLTALVPFSGWGGLILLAGAMTLLSCALGYFVILNAADRNYFIEKIRKR